MTRLRTRPAGRRPWRTVGGLLLGGLLLAAYLGVVGVEDVRRVLSTVPPNRVRSLLLVGVTPLVFWGAGLHLVLGRLGRPLRLRTSVLLYTASGFLNAVTPFGQAGGDPATAVLFGRAIGTDFETGLAAIGSLNALNRVVAVCLGALGAGYLGSGLAAGNALRAAAVLAAGLSMAVAAVLVVGWRYRRRIVGGFAAALAPPLRGGARAVPGVDPPTRESIERRGYRFVDALDRLASDPRRLAAVFGLSVAGHLAVASTLWIALAALGYDASIAVVLLVIPLAKLAGLAPTPGGLGSSEALLAVLLASATGVADPIAGAAVLLYRASAFWLPSLLGGLITGWFVVVGNGTDPNSGGRSTSEADGASPARSDASATSRLRSAAGTPSAGQTGSTVPRILLALAVSLAVLVAAAMHRSHLVVEPNSLVVHLMQDVSLVVLGFALTWALVRRLPRGWFG